jgi:hypothetical protein
LLRTLLLAGLATVAVVAQPKFPQHSTGMPSVQLPAINNHVTNLSGAVAGRPMVQRPGARPIYVGGPGFIGGGWVQQPQYLQPQPVVIMNQQAAPPPTPILVMNPEYKQETAPNPVMREYSAVSTPYANFQPSAPKVFLLALKDGTLRQAVAFWAEGDTLHFVQPDHKQDSVTFVKLDREASKRFNSERGIEIKLPD